MAVKDRSIRDIIPDVRDGLTRRERIVMHVLHETQKERGGRNVPTAMLWGRYASISTSRPRNFRSCWRDWGLAGTEPAPACHAT